jgi:hypothetical protein
MPRIADELTGRTHAVNIWPVYKAVSFPGEAGGITLMKTIRVSKNMKWVSTIALIFVLSACSAIAQSSAASSPGTAATGQASPHKEASKSSSKSAGTASDSEIASAKASGKVWVNTDSGVYHKSGRWYGTTKAGKFMTESEAKAAGYKATKKQ